ncbi:ABC transporter substrate-binding protein [Desulfobacterales bacterium HSG2]|nr:ABC transporter substrate-binding protein [Desulfobacterales bacterium HSG2]
MKNVCVKMMMCLLIVVLCSGQGFAKDPVQPLTVRLNWIPNVQFAGILLAKERGWYKDADVDLTIKGWEEGISPTSEVLSGKAQLAIIEGIEFIRTRTEGNAVKAIATVFQKSPFCLMSKQEQGIDSPEKLIGKKIGIDSQETELMIKIMLSSRGLKFEGIIPVPVGWDLDPLIKGEVDAYPAFMNDQPLLMKELGHKVSYIPALEHGYDFYSGVCFVTETMIQKQPDMIRKFLDATLRGWRESFKDPAGTAKLVVEKYYPKGSVSQQTESLKVFKFLARLGEGRKYLGWMEEEYWAKGIDILHKFKQTDRKIPAADVFTMKFLEDVYFGKKK